MHSKQKPYLPKSDIHVPINHHVGSLLPYCSIKISLASFKNFVESFPADTKQRGRECSYVLSSSIHTVINLIGLHDLKTADSRKLLNHATTSSH